MRADSYVSNARLYLHWINKIGQGSAWEPKYVEPVDRFAHFMESGGLLLCSQDSKCSPDLQSIGNLNGAKSCA
jgi:hypothetical protein